MAFWNLIAKISADTTGFQVGVKQAESAVNGFSRGVLDGMKSQIAAAFGAGAIIAFAKSSIEAAARIKDLSEQSGLSTKAVQDIGDAFRKSGLQAEDGIDAFNKLAEARQKALGGDAQSLSFFNQLGISIKQLAQETDSLQLAKKVGAGLEAFGQQDRSVIQKALFGRSGARLTGALSDVSKPTGMPQFSDEEVAKLDSISKSAEMMKQGATVGGGKIITKIGDAIKSFFGGDDNSAERIRLMERDLYAKKHPGIFGSKEEDQKRLVDPQSSKDSIDAAKIYEDIAQKQFENSLKVKTLDEQRLAIAGKIKEMEEEITKLNEDGSFLDAAQKQKRLEALQSQFLGVGEYAQDKFKPETTALQRVGAQGGAIDSIPSTLKAQLDEQRKIAQATKRMAEASIDSSQVFP